jgi:paraquat-inducible protein B
MSEPLPEAEIGDLPMARLEPRGRRSAMWLVPVAALMVVAAFVAREWWQRGPLVTVSIPKATGIEAGRTRVLSRGVPIGSVEHVRLDESLERPIVEIRLERWASAFAREGASYWVVTPSINFHGVSGLETLASGPVIEARPGEGTAASLTRFDALLRAPSTSATLGDFQAGSPDALRVTLTAPRLGSIRAGSPVTYRDVEVGEVLATELAPDARGTLIHLAVHDRYAQLVRENSQFWGRGGLGLDLGMTGFKLRTESLESILGGGIAFATPDAPGGAVRDGHRFELLEDEPKNWFKWIPTFDMK